MLRSITSRVNRPRADAGVAMVSVKDVAAAASVSVGTVSNVLNRRERVAPDTVERVLRAIDELGFVRNDAARQLRAGRSGSIGLAVLDLRNPFFADVARGAEDRAAEEGLSLLVADSREDPVREARHLALFAHQRAFGVLLSPTGDDLAPAAQLVAGGIPTVLVDRDGGDAPISSVSVDDVHGGRLAAEHLLQRGCRRLAFVGGPKTIRQVRDRHAGAAQAAAEVPGATIEWLMTGTLSVEAGRDAGHELVSRDASARPDGVFAANDLVAVGLLQALAMTARLRVPEDIALIGYDDIDFAASAVVPLTSVRQPATRLGATAVELLLDAHSTRRVSFRPEIVVRDSA